MGFVVDIGAPTKKGGQWNYLKTKLSKPTVTFKKLNTYIKSSLYQYLIIISNVTVDNIYEVNHNFNNKNQRWFIKYSLCIIL